MTNNTKIKQANTIIQRFKLLKKCTNNVYTMMEHPYYGYTIFKNGVKFYDTLFKINFEIALGGICRKEGLIDLYSNIIKFKEDGYKN